ncbi:MAG: hypothetical protein ABSE55_02550 [Terracidiphilus sp.]|jgi:hypothetical protein
MPLTTEIRTSYAAADQMAVVYYANYFVWFDAGRLNNVSVLGPGRLAASPSRLSPPSLGIHLPPSLHANKKTKTRPLLHFSAHG